MLRRLFLAVSTFVLAAFATSSQSVAQDYPSQAVRFIIPFAPGGGADVHGRLTAELLSQRLGQPIVVESKPGAGGAIGADYVAKSKPDGYTLLYASSDTLSVGPAVKATMPYKIPDDFTYVGRTLNFPYVILVNPSLPINSVTDLIAYAKANPGKLRYGSAGAGSLPHLATEIIARTVGLQLVHVPYGGAGPALTALMGGFVDFVIAAPTAKNFVDGGKLRAIGVTGTAHNPDFPSAQTLGESGLKDITVTIWWGLCAAAGTPEPILAKLRQSLDAIVKDPKTAERLKAIGYETDYLDHNAFRDFVIRDLEKWRGVAENANIKVD